MSEVRAAGGVVVDAEGRVLVAHRPRYDDWSLPKGKLEPGEDWENAALREVREETGVRAALGPLLGDEHYTDHKGRPKTVRWWRMEPLEAPPFAPNDEVDEIRWLTPADARGLLSYASEIGLLDRLAAE
jgi:8-oxo-dGTP diphosphatase